MNDAALLADAVPQRAAWRIIIDFGRGSDTLRTPPSQTLRTPFARGSQTSHTPPHPPGRPWEGRVGPPLRGRLGGEPTARWHHTRGLMDANEMMSR
jgi:hypothetical protein